MGTVEDLVWVPAANPDEHLVSYLSNTVMRLKWHLPATTEQINHSWLSLCFLRYKSFIFFMGRFICKYRLLSDKVNELKLS